MSKNNQKNMLMKNNLIISLFFFITINLIFSQVKKQDLYLFMNEPPESNIVADTIIWQRFHINFENGKYSTNTLLVDNIGNLKQNLLIKATSNKIVVLDHKNMNFKNNATLILQKQIINYLIIEDVLKSCSFENFREISKKFNVFIIEEAKNSQPYYIAKKVEVIDYGGL